jgi:hypothetical protein
MKIKLALLSLGIFLASLTNVVAETNVTVESSIDDTIIDKTVINTVESISSIDSSLDDNPKENVGVSLELIRGLSKPSKDKVINLTKSKLSFSGYADHSTLYTNNNFTGKSKITYRVTNYGNKKLTVKLHKRFGGLFATETLIFNPNSTTTGTISGLDKGILYYLKFLSPSDFSGCVK